MLNAPIMWPMMHDILAFKAAIVVVISVQLMEHLLCLKCTTSAPNAPNSV